MSCYMMRQPIDIANGTFHNAEGIVREIVDSYGFTAGNAPEFQLSDEFLGSYKGKDPNFGYNGLGEITYYRTYSRVKDNGGKERFWETANRVVNGTFEIQRRHCQRFHLPWDRVRAQDSAQEMYERMWQFKFLPPGRGLWVMGTPFMWRAGGAGLNNCGFVSTNDDFHLDPAQPFAFAMDMLMLGVGIGFDTKGAGRVPVRKPADRTTRYIIDDSREGWVIAFIDLMHSYTIRPELGKFKFDFSEIRPAGTQIKGFGGEASGPGELEKLLARVDEFMSQRVNTRLNSVDITDLMNMVGKCVVAGNVRRSAEIAFGFPEDIEYRSMKNPVRDLSPEETGQFYEVTGKLYGENRYTATNEDFKDTTIAQDKLGRAIEVWNACNDRRWASNNSVFSHIGMDYQDVGEQTAANGEPGYIWLDNCRDHGRMKDGRQPGIDGRVMGSNPCVEQTLESYELCNLVETFPVQHTDEDDYWRTIKYAYMYAKTVTLLPTHNDRTNQVMLRNRRIGLSQSGIVQGFEKFGRRTYLQNFCDASYSEIRRWDAIYSEWLVIRESIKVTSVKPSGTVSLLAGVAPGVHFPEARSYWRRMRINKNHSLVRILSEAGYHIEPAATDPDNTVVVKFGVEDEGVRPVGDVSIWEQMDNVAAMQHYWADNAVSVTVKFSPDEARDIPKILEHYEDRIKAVSFLPKTDHGYVQAPYEAADPAEVRDYLAGLKEIDMSELVEEAVGERYCDSDKCVLN